MSTSFATFCRRGGFVRVVIVSRNYHAPPFIRTDHLFGSALFSTTAGPTASTCQPTSKWPKTAHRPPAADPMARRPTIKCDPYGQGGKPLSETEARSLLATVDDEWRLEYSHHHDDDVEKRNEANLVDATTSPLALTREYVHPDYLSATRFLHKLAAVALVQAHFPASISVERRIVRKQWQIVSRIVCHTTVLEGLSHHDFHLAMMMDVEAARPELQALIIQEKDESA